MIKLTGFRGVFIIGLLVGFGILLVMNCRAEEKTASKDQPEDKTTSAVLKGLNWLAKTQDKEGSWKKREEDKDHAGVADFETGLTSLALLAFMESGFTHQTKSDYQETVAQGLKFLLAQQKENGEIANPNEAVLKMMYNHSIATCALTKIYELTKDEKLKKPRDTAVKFLIDAQNPGGGWRYKPRTTDYGSDMSVTSWCFKALKTAQRSKEVDDGIKTHLDAVTDIGDIEYSGGVGYIEKGSCAIMAHERDRFDSGNLYLAPSLTAIGIMCRLSMKEDPSNELISKSVKFLIKDANLPKWDKDHYGKIDYYYWHWGTQAILSYSGRDGQEFKKWKSVLEPILLEQQKKGTWEPIDRWSSEGGTTYVTAINILTLLALSGKTLIDVKIQEVKVTPELEKKIRELIIQLDAEDWQMRESAQEELTTIGEPAIPYLKEALNSPSAEVKMRVKLILKNIE